MAGPDSETRICVECRIPTYRRPELLQRALLSLQRQTCSNWRAIVLDDSESKEGANVVHALDDTRITYRHNEHRLGATGNLDQAFSPAPLLDGDFAFVLEDDNAIEPEFIEVGMLRLARSDVDILSFNQRCVHATPTGMTPGATLRTALDEEVWGRERLLLNAFLTISLPNGGYFWRLRAGIDLRVGSGVTEPQLQECIRQVRVPRTIALLPQPLSLWSMLPPIAIRRQLVGNRRLAANLNQLSAAVVAEVGPERLVNMADVSGNADLLGRVRQTLADLSLISPRCRAWFRQQPSSALRSKLRFHLYRDSLGDALAAVGQHHD